MIFITVGMHYQPFDRLIEAADHYAAIANEKVIIQLGSSKYVPKHAEYFDYEEMEKIIEIMEEARVIVSHAGAGSILLSLKLKKPLVLAARSKDFDEVIDNHQSEITSALSEVKRAVECNPITTEGLGVAIKAAVQQLEDPINSTELIKSIKHQLSLWSMG